MISNKVERSNVLLSVQRALLGEVFPALRAVTVEWTEDSIRFFAYIDGPISENDIESISFVATEVVADFCSGTTIDYEVIRKDFPEEVNDKRTWMFYRREST